MIDTLILRRQDEAQDICSLELGAADGTPLPPFEPGAHIDVHLAPGLVRQYSLCPRSDQAGRYLIGVLLEPASRGGSQAVHALQAGQALRIGMPRNQFALAPGARRSLLFAGGIGITPLLAMAERLADQGADLTLHCCSRTPARLAFGERLRTGPLNGRVRLHFDDGPPAQKLDLDEALGAPEPDTHVYVCGPSGFMDWVLTGAQARGWPSAQLHREYFAAPAASAAATAGAEASFEVTLASTGASYRVPPGQSVIEVLAAHGVEVPVSCEQGVCGTCLTRVLEGTPDHRDVFLTDDEHRANDCFTPCCSRALSPRLVIDL
ncbi:MAG: oxidoreductase [Comamonadaceae bacterium]|nr:MAG: oxidoreductase [Comamonadaceae bacterium]